MAISKVILNNTTLIDVTQKTVTADSMLSGTTALKNDGTDISGNIASKTSTNLSASGATVTAPAGYYASDASKSVASGSATTPATTITANPSISVSSGGLITASVSASQSVTPTVGAGYVSSGTAGTVSVSGSNTSQLTTKAAATYYPSTSDQNISASQYLTGAQTIKAVEYSDTLIASNIADGVTVTIGDADDDDRILSVTGTMQGMGSVQPLDITPTINTQLYGSQFELIQTINYTNTGYQTLSPATVVGVTYRYVVKARHTGEETWTVLLDDDFIGASAMQVLMDRGNSILYQDMSTRLRLVSKTVYYTAWDEICVERYKYSSEAPSSAYAPVKVRASKIQPLAIEPTLEEQVIDEGYNYSSTQMGYVAATTVGSTEMTQTLTVGAKYVLVVRPNNNFALQQTKSFTCSNEAQVITPQVSISPTAIIVTDLASYSNLVVYVYQAILVDGYLPIVVAPGYSQTIMKNLISRSASLTSFVFPNGITEIGDGAFMRCSRLNINALPSTITHIYSYAFDQCAQLSLTSLPSTLVYIGDYAFRNCSNVSISSIPSNTVTLGTRSFEGCTSITSISIPGGISSMGNYAFYNCTGLTQAQIANGVSTIGNYAFGGCYNLETITLPSSITTIAGYAFNQCASLTSVSCDGALTGLAGYAFAGSSSREMQLRSAKFPNITNIPMQPVFGNSTAANACHYLEEADVGNVTNLNSYAFANCYSLQTLVLRKADSVCTLNDSYALRDTPFSGYNGLTGTVYVPSALISSYKTATNWSTLYTNGTCNFVAIEGSVWDLS